MVLIAPEESTVPDAEVSKLTATVVEMPLTSDEYHSVFHDCTFWVLFMFRRMVSRGVAAGFISVIFLEMVFISNSLDAPAATFVFGVSWVTAPAAAAKARDTPPAPASRTLSSLNAINSPAINRMLNAILKIFFVFMVVCSFGL